MTASPPFEYDVFVDYSRKDAQWVETELVPHLETAGLRVLLDVRDFSAKESITREMERAVQCSRKVLLVLTPAYVESEWTELTWRMALTLDPSNRRHKLVLLLRQKAELPLALRQLTYLDFTRDEIRQQTWDRLLRALEEPDRRKPDALADQVVQGIPERTRAEESVWRVGTNQDDFRVRLHEDLTHNFSLDELRTLCFYLDLDWDTLPGEESRNGRAREIIVQAERRGIVPRLIEQCRRLRPDVEWIDAPEISGDTRMASGDGIPIRSSATFSETSGPALGPMSRFLEPTASSTLSAPEVTLPEDETSLPEKAFQPADTIAPPTLPAPEEAAQPLETTVPSTLPASEATLPGAKTPLAEALTTPERIEIPAQALADKPSDIDLLGFSDYADALADFIKHPKTAKPLTLGIDAPWGMGKTTLMRMLRERLAQPKSKSALPTVWFDAWKYDSEESLWAALVLEILAQVREQSSLWQRLLIWTNLNRRRFDWRQLFKSFLKALAYLAGITILGATLYIVLLPLLGVELQSKLQELWEENAGALLGGAGLVTLAYTLIRDFVKNLVHPFDLRINRYVSESRYKERIGFLAEFEDDFKRVIETVTRRGKRPLVVFIDDLDRCAPPKPAEIAEAVNILLDAEHCVFVIGMDAQAVACSIESRYKDLAAHYAHESDGFTLGQRFLEKIVQISFHIPQPTGDQIGSFIVKMLKVSPGQTESQTILASVAEAEKLITQQRQSGKILDEAVEAVERARPDLGKDVLEQAAQGVYATIFDDSEEVHRAIREVTPYLEYNPRKIKRFINLFRLQALIANRRGLLQSGVIRLDQLAKWAVLSMRWPDGVQMSAADEHFRVSAKRLDALFTRPRPSDPTGAQQVETEVERLIRNRALRSIAESAQLRELLKATEYFGDPTRTRPYKHLMGIATTSSQT